MEMYIIDYYPPDGTIMSTTTPVEDKVDPTLHYIKPDTTNSNDDYHAGTTKACAPEWESLLDFCTVVVDGYIIPQDHPKHKGVKCKYFSDKDKSFCYYKLEDQR